MFKYYDRNGKIIPETLYEKLWRDENYRVVKQEVLPNGDTVSTVWLGLDFNPNPYVYHLPVIFETRIFAPKKEYNENCWRWCTEQQAIEGHEYVVTTISSTEAKFVEIEEEEKQNESSDSG